MARDTARYIALTAAALLMLAGPGSARVMLEQCNKQIDGVFTPVLIVRNGTSSTTVQAGTNGLTSSMILSKSRAIAWARQQFDLGNAPVSYAQCGMGSDNDRRNR